MDFDINAATTIRRARGEIAPVMFDPHFMPAWMGGVREVFPLEGEAPTPGATFERDISQYFQSRTEVWEVLDYVRETSLVLSGEDATWRFHLEGAPVGTIVWISAKFSVQGWRRVILLPWLAFRARRAAIRDLRRLKQFIESAEYLGWGQEAEESF